MTKRTSTSSVFDGSERSSLGVCRGIELTVGLPRAFFVERIIECCKRQIGELCVRGN